MAFGVDSQALAESKLTPEVENALAGLAPGQTLTVIVHMREQADLRNLRTSMRREGRLQTLSKLHATAELNQRDVKSALERHRRLGRLSRFKPYWIFNGFSVTGKAEVIRELAARPDVEQVSADEVAIVPQGAPYTHPEPNLTAIGAPDLWVQGYFGQGVVVANLDTGVDVTHPELQSKWRGGAHDWFDAFGTSTQPYDGGGTAAGHGTQTLGIMVGGNAGLLLANGTDCCMTVGVAPQAQWIAAKIFRDIDGKTTATAIHSAFQWVLDPDSDPATDDAPDVVNNSWSWATGNVCNLEFATDLQNLRAAGILPVFAAGNFGPTGASSVSPANNPGALAVGQSNNAGTIDSSSSRGPAPVACGRVRYPDLVAPGVAIPTTDRFQLYSTVSGTSFSSPHVAGALALLLSAYPELTVDQQQQVLIQSAVDGGAVGVDDIYGNGRLSATGAFNWLQANVGPPVGGETKVVPFPAWAEATFAAALAAIAHTFRQRLGKG